MRRGTEWSQKDFCLKRLPKVTYSSARFHNLLSDIRACVHIVSLKVIVGIRGLNGENTYRGDPVLHNVSARWIVETRVY